MTSVAKAVKFAFVASSAHAMCADVATNVASVNMKVTEQFCIDMGCWFYDPEDTNNDIKNNHCRYRLSPSTCKRAIESLENDSECEKERG